MERKYQIFISSTYEDLKEERQKVQEVILSMHQFPIGMEMFSAGNKEQWDVIKETIACSDYYVLIVAHRYGSVITEGEDKGMSYTEKEYRYAKKIGIPVLVFIIDDSATIKEKNVEKGSRKIKKLNDFKTEIKKGRIVEWWVNKEDLGQKLSVALHKQFTREKRLGWVRVESDLNIMQLVKPIDTYGVPYDKAWATPMYAQEDQDTYRFVKNAKEIIFCARTGKGFLNGHYNLLKDFINDGGHLKFLTTEQYNLIFDDKGEHLDNRNNSLRFLQNLYAINNENVECRILNVPLNLTLLYIKTHEDVEFVEVKFVFHSNLNLHHPIMRLTNDSPFFDNFYAEVMNLYGNGIPFDLGRTATKS